MQNQSLASKYLSLIKFSHTIFALPFALIGYFYGLLHDNLSFDWPIFIYVLLCMVFARSAAMAFNRYLDRDIDKLNPRTVVREIPSGVIKARSALFFVILNCILFVLTTLMINKLCFYLSPIALIVILGYSFTKRFTALCHVILGIGLSLAPLGAFIAVTNHFALVPVLFSVIVLLWVSGFDIIYALQDEEFDKSQNLRSIPAALGKRSALNVSTILHVACGFLVIACGFYMHSHLWYWIGAAVFIGMLIYQHTLVKPDDLRKVNIAFMTANGIASITFAVFVITDFLVK
jgi:4-hydroxybenzoate polyprenyltransferase